MTEVRSDGQLEDKSLGELVKVATESVSKLVKSEIALARLELTEDAKRVGLGGALFLVAAFAVGGLLLMFSFAAAYGFMYIVPGWLAFVIVGVIYFLLAALLCLIGYLRMRKMSRVSRTRKTMKDDFAMLRRGSSDDQPALTE